MTLWHWIDRADSLKEYNDNDDDVDVYVDVDVHVGVGVDGENGDDCKRSVLVQLMQQANKLGKTMQKKFHENVTIYVGSNDL